MLRWLEIERLEFFPSSSTPAVVIPGWGFSGEMLQHVPWLASRVLIVQEAKSATFVEELRQLCEAKGWQKVALCGWSWGARLALEFAEKHPERVAGLALVSLRLEYPKAEIEEQKGLLLSDPQAYLTHFYRRCFVGQKELGQRWLPLLCQWHNLDNRLPDLLAGLDDLAARIIQPTELLAANAHLGHGQRDLIAPWKTWMPVLKRFPQLPCKLFPLAGHVPLFDADFVPWLTEVWKLR